MDARRFVILYQRQRNETLEREVVGQLADAMETAWDMLRDGHAKVAAIVEPGNLDLHVWHHRIVQWGQEEAVRSNRPSGRPDIARTAA